MIRLEGFAALVIGAPSDIFRTAGARIVDAADTADILFYTSPSPQGSFAEAIAHGLQPAFVHARTVLGAMRARQRGTIVFCAPPAADHCPATAAIAGGLVTLARSIAYQYGGDNIRANTLLPGPRATPADIAAAALLLASPDSSFMTGACLPVGQDAPSSWPA